MCITRNATDGIVDYILKLMGKPLPPSVREKAKQCVLDYYGVAFAGAAMNRENLAAMLTGEPGKCEVVGGDRCASLYEAAFVNAFNAHSTELDDGSRFGMIHLGAAIISAVLALAQERALTYERALIGIVAGYEAAVRVSLAMQPSHKKRGFHTSGTCGTIGAAVGCACAMGCDRKQLKAAISAAATGAAGLLEIQEDASTLKPYNVGHASMAGVNAACVGMSGFVGPDDILGGKRGMFNLLSDQWDMDVMTAPADYYEIERIYVKPYAACRHCHSAIEATLALRENGVTPEAITEMDIRTYALAVRGHDHTDIRGAASAKLSMPFVVAAAYVLGSAGLESFTDEVLGDERILTLAKKVHVTADEEMSAQSGRMRAAEVCLVADGQAYTHRVDYAKGDPENPLSREELIDKFRMLMRWSGAQDRTEEIINRVLT